MIILLLGFSPWSELMERTMSFASWLLPRHPSSLLGGVASSVGPFPASGTPGLAPLCPGLRACWLSAWQPEGGHVLKVWGCLFHHLLSPHCLRGCVVFSAQPWVSERCWHSWGAGKIFHQRIGEWTESPPNRLLLVCGHWDTPTTSHNPTQPGWKAAPKTRPSRAVDPALPATLPSLPAFSPRTGPASSGETHLLISDASLHPWKTSLVAQRVKHLPTMWGTWVWSLSREASLEKEMATYSSTLAWKTPWT